jgi:hypothetical protein
MGVVSRRITASGTWKNKPEIEVLYSCDWMPGVYWGVNTGLERCVIVEECGQSGGSR